MTCQVPTGHANRLVIVRPFTVSTPSRAPVREPVPTAHRMNSTYTSSDRIHRNVSVNLSLSWSSSEPSQNLIDWLLASSLEHHLSWTADVHRRGFWTLSASTASPDVFRSSRSPTENSPSRTQDSSRYRRDSILVTAISKGKHTWSHGRSFIEHEFEASLVFC